ncbi:MAG: U32 family peptidase [Lentisphaeria bacterium]|jgi:collagenase-like PrtC family protease|nr:U32 family peptidase [Lentisphaeria bacterium]MDY0175374.1 U32 family peptidase [Lentisphaeria bacterium]NLZ59059.1 hypothetical protein [Lentisphaerota bacterium]
MTRLTQLEIMAPAGGRAELEAGIEAGAEAIYFGLKRLNARQGAENFAPEELAETVALLHKHGVLAYLTLNTELTQRELGLAARSLQLAAESGVDAVIVRDAALLQLRAFFPDLDFHFSTQAGISSSAGMQAAKRLGLQRVVLARELSREEIRAAAALPGIACEVFVQGALCFSVSGRCLLSSWGGGRSGNRGACSSPCRVPWQRPEGEGARIFSMYDLSLVECLPELADCGVKALKIEGRLKSADWVAQALRLFQAAKRQQRSAAELREEAEQLGDYSGRPLSQAFFAGKLNDISGESGRPRRRLQAQTDSVPTASRQASIALRFEADGALIWDFSWRGHRGSERIARQRIASARRAMSIEELHAELLRQAPGGLKWRLQCAPELQSKLLPRRCLKTLQESMNRFCRLANKQAEGQVRVKLPEKLESFLLASHKPHPANRQTLGMRPRRLRVGRAELEWLRKQSRNALDYELIYACELLSTTEAMRSQLAALSELGPALSVLALPAQFYEAQLPLCELVLDYAEQAGLAVELNSWDGWQLASGRGLPLEGGPGLAVLNANAARFLQECGMRSSSISCEIDREQLEQLCAEASTALALTVFARPALMRSRVRLPEGFAPGQAEFLRDARDIELLPRLEGGMTVLRARKPFDWRALHNPRVKVTHLLLDLQGSDDPDGDLRSPGENPFLFNYERGLK